jgi:hypothetical protein
VPTSGGANPGLNAPGLVPVPRERPANPCPAPEKLRAGAEDARMGAEKPRPCPEAEIATPMVSATANPNLDIVFAMAVEAEQPSILQMSAVGPWLQALRTLASGAAELPNLSASMLYVSLVVRSRQASSERVNSDSGLESRQKEQKNENPSNFCPVCSARLEAHKCKLRCPTCGYYMSCSDYY